MSKTENTCSCGRDPKTLTGAINSIEFIPMSSDEKKRFELAIEEGKTYKPNISFKSPFVYKIKL